MEIPTSSPTNDPHHHPPPIHLQGGVNACKIRMPCFDQTDARPRNELASHNRVALGILGEGEGSLGRGSFKLVHVLAPGDLAPLGREKKKEK